MKRLRSKTVAAVGLCLFGLAPVRSAEADPSAADKSIATQLFKEGRALLDQGRVGPACRKLEESERIDPGGGTLLNLALCHEREGRTATAWVEFTEALGVAKRDERPQRVEFARAHIGQLEPVLSRLVLEVPSAADLPDLEVRRDGSVVGRAAWGSPIPVDPGDHVIEAAAPGKSTWKQSVVVGARADTKVVAIPALEDAAAQDSASSLAPAPIARAAAPRDSGDDGSASERQPHDQQPAGSGGSTAPAWIAIAVGVAASGAGTYFALNAVSLKSDADHNCPNDACSAQGAQQTSDAIKSANFATASFAVGIVGVGLGAILFATRSSSHGTGSAAHSAPVVASVTGGNVFLGPGGGEIGISGRW